MVAKLCFVLRGSWVRQHFREMYVGNGQFMWYKVFHREKFHSGSCSGDGHPAVCPEPFDEKGEISNMFVIRVRNHVAARQLHFSRLDEDCDMKSR